MNLEPLASTQEDLVSSWSPPLPPRKCPGPQAGEQREGTLRDPGTRQENRSRVWRPRQHGIVGRNPETKTGSQCRSGLEYKPSELPDEEAAVEV